MVISEKGLVKTLIHPLPPAFWRLDSQTFLVGLAKQNALSILILVYIVLIILPITYISYHPWSSILAYDVDRSFHWSDTSSYQTQRLTQRLPEKHTITLLSLTPYLVEQIKGFRSFVRHFREVLCLFLNNYICWM